MLSGLLPVDAQTVKKNTTPPPPAQKDAKPSSQDDGPVALTPRTNVDRKVENAPSAAPKTNQLGNFGFPLLNNNGDVAFTARYVSEKSEGGYGSAILVRKGDGTWDFVRDGDKGNGFTAPLLSVNHVFLNDKGELTFTGTLDIKTPSFKISGGDVDVSGNLKQGGVFTKTADGLKAVYLMGQEIPNNPATYIGFSSASMNSKGTLAFIGTYTDPDGRGLFILENGKLSIVARSGQKTPAGEDTQYSEHFYPTTINERGELAFFCRISGGGAIFIRRPKGIETIAIQDKPSPIPGSNYIGFGNRAPAISSNGLVTFVGFIDGEKAGRVLFVKGEGTPQVVVRNGDTVPGMTTTFADFYMPAINAKGEIVFVGNYGGRARGVFVKTAEGIEPIALYERPVPGLDPKDERNSFNNFVNPVINDNGDVAFMAQLRNSSVGIFLKKKGEPLKMVARTGDMAPFK
ncbi:MAG TPA: choice-of-anchor tandem repeat NxxGxxAF-containing protein [Blastocatellia bacterium]|nr:choice-of-anchor tandem repeat NxxGxxAF-containing protein [Blastocatellia bacterium]